MGYSNLFFIRMNIICYPGKPNVKRKIIVIGAGASGMTATRQLKRFGFEVVLLEGRVREKARKILDIRGSRERNHGNMSCQGFSLREKIEFAGGKGFNQESSLERTVSGKG